MHLAPWLGPFQRSQQIVSGKPSPDDDEGDDEGDGAEARVRPAAPMLKKKKSEPVSAPAEKHSCEPQEERLGLM